MFTIFQYYVYLESTLWFLFSYLCLSQPLLCLLFSSLCFQFPCLCHTSTHTVIPLFPMFTVSISCKFSETIHTLNSILHTPCKQHFHTLHFHLIFFSTQTSFQLVPILYIFPWFSIFTILVNSLISPIFSVFSFPYPLHLKHIFVPIYPL